MFAWNATNSWNASAGGSGTVSNVIAVVASANWTNVLWDNPETGDNYITNLLTFTIPHDGLYSIGAGYSTPVTAGAACAESHIYLRYQTRDGAWIVSDGIQSYQNPGTSEPSWFPQVNGYAGQTIIVSNYCLESYDGGGDAKATNYVRTYIYGPTNISVAAAASTTKVYRALLTQTGTDAPVATVLENSLGGTLVWTRADIGNYIATLSGVFLSNKTFCRGYFSTESGGDSLHLFPLSRVDNDSVTLISVNVDTSADGLMSNIPVEILVYP